MSAEQERLLSAAIRVLRFLEGQGSGSLAKSAPAEELREAIIGVSGGYTSRADELAQEKAALLEQIKGEAAP